jgi:Tfp pilus assembly protein PilN
MIAARRAEKHRLEQNTRKLVYGVLAELGLILVAVSFMLAQLITTQTHIGVLEAQIKNLQPKVDDIKQLESSATALQPKVQVLDTARGDTMYWYSAFQSLAQSLPSKTWVTSVTTAGTPSGAATPGVPAAANSSGGGTLTVAGVSSSQDEVGQAMLKINSFPNFDQAVLGSLQKSDIGKVSAVNFQMTIQLKPEVNNSSSQTASVPGGNNVQKS